MACHKIDIENGYRDIVRCMTPCCGECHVRNRDRVGEPHVTPIPHTVTHHYLPWYRAPAAGLVKCEFLPHARSSSFSSITTLPLLTGFLPSEVDVMRDLNSQQNIPELITVMRMKVLFTNPKYYRKYTKRCSDGHCLKLVPWNYKWRSWMKCFRKNHCCQTKSRFVRIFVAETNCNLHRIPAPPSLIIIIPRIYLRLPIHRHQKVSHRISQYMTDTLQS